MPMSVNTAVRAVVRSPGNYKVAPLGVVVLAGRCVHFLLRLLY